MASKFVALKDGDGFKAGDDVTVAQAGENANQLVADGVIAERGSTAEAQAPETDAQAEAEAPNSAPRAAVDARQGPATFVTLGNSDPAGIPQFDERPQEQG